MKTDEDRLVSVRLIVGRIAMVGCPWGVTISPIVTNFPTGEKGASGQVVQDAEPAIAMLT